MMADRQTTRQLFLCLSLLASTTMAQSTWRTHHRLQVGYERDSNVLEAINHEQGADNLRLLLDLKAQRRGLSLAYQGGYQLYPGYAEENKLANEFSVGLQHRIAANVDIGVQVWARLKIFLNSDQDLARGNWQPFVQWTLSSNTSLRTGYRQDVLDYARSDYFDYDSPGFFLQWRQRLFANWTIVPTISLNQNRFQRTAQRLWGSTPGLMMEAVRQQDDITTAGVYNEWLWRSLLLSLNYTWQQNRSNSYGYNYDRHGVTVMFTEQLGAFFVRGYMTWQKKKYRDALLPFLPIELDTEQEENNFYVLDVSRDLWPDITAVVRWAWYKNESPWANLYYKKTLLQTFLEWRF
jgi:hypothetical protein